MGVRQKAQRCRWKILEKSQASGISLRAAGACRYHRRQLSPVMIYAQKGVCLGEQGYTVLECAPAESSASTPRAYGREKSQHLAIFSACCRQSTQFARYIENLCLESSALKTSVCLKVPGFYSPWLLLPFLIWPAHTLSLFPGVRGYDVSPGPWRLSFAFLPVGEGFHGHECLYRSLEEVARKPLVTCLELTLRFPLPGLV